MIEHRDIEYWKNEMFRYDKEISQNIECAKNRTQMSEKSLADLRDFVESVSCFIAKFNASVKYENRYIEIQEAVKFCGSKHDYSFLPRFINNLNASIGHQTFFGEYAERLFLKYVSQLLLIKDILRKKHKIDVLKSLDLFPFDLDNTFKDYYVKISNILFWNDVYNGDGEKDTFYIQKKKMIYVNGVVFYEYTFTHAMDRNTKFDRFIAFSLLDISPNYAIQAAIIKKSTDCFEQVVNYAIVIDFKIAIRPCEIEKLASIIGVQTNSIQRSKDYHALMEYLKFENTNLTEIVCRKKEHFYSFISKVFTTKTKLCEILERCHFFILSNNTGSNTLRYLLFKMNNVVLNNQKPLFEEDSLSSINLSKKVYAFEKSPFTSGLVKHVPSFKDLIEVFDYNEHEHEILARCVENYSTESSCIYIPKDKFNCSKIEENLSKYNRQFLKESLYGRRIYESKGYLYLGDNEENTVFVLEKFKEYSNTKNFEFYKEYITSRISELSIKIEDPTKQKALERLFECGSVFAVYGPAGTGKSFFASYVLKVLGNINKICISSTNPAVENMKRKFEDNTAKYMTITKFLNKYNTTSSIDLLIIDECSTVSTSDIRNILEKTNPKLILLLGDIFQIQAISFGNWFSLLRKVLSDSYYVDLNTQYRTESETLIDFWNEVRKIGPNIQEKLSSNQISHVFDKTVFDTTYSDEIILCLNYDGLYGINNINKVLQKNNPTSREHNWKQHTYKVGDPIIFDGSYYYRDVFHNNLKGRILGIQEDENKFVFTVKVKKLLSAIECRTCNISLIEIDKNETVVSFEVNKYKEDVYDRDTDPKIHVPFQIAYALSIHKAQGLEYDSVKLLITNEVEENITHNIFYTAITRAKKNLTIYWTQESEKKIVSSFYVQSYDMDFSILSSKYDSLTDNPK